MLFENHEVTAIKCQVLDGTSKFGLDFILCLSCRTAFDLSLTAALPNWNAMILVLSLMHKDLWQWRAECLSDGCLKTIDRKEIMKNVFATAAMFCLMPMLAFADDAQ